MNASPARWCIESVTCFPRCRQGCTHRICPAGVWLTGHRPCAKHFPKHLPRALTDPQWRPPGHCGAFLSGRPGAAKIGDHSCPFYWEGNDGAKCREGLGIEHRNVPLPSLHARDPNSSSPGPAASWGACGRKHAICMFQGHTQRCRQGAVPSPVLAKCTVKVRLGPGGWDDSGDTCSPDQGSNHAPSSSFLLMRHPGRQQVAASRGGSLPPTHWETPVELAAHGSHLAQPWLLQAFERNESQDGRSLSFVVS